MSRVTIVRDEIEVLHNDLCNGGCIISPDLTVKLERWAGLLRRNPVVRKTPPKSDPVTVNKCVMIIEGAGRHPEMSKQALAETLRICDARVSEVLGTVKDLQEHPDWSIQQLKEHRNVSKRHVKRVVKALTGSPFWNGE